MQILAKITEPFKSFSAFFATLFRNGIVTLVGILILVALVVGGQALYSLIDKDTFPESFAFTQTDKEEEKAAILLDAITNQLRYELDSTFGWSANDVLFHPIVLDNRAYRQLGVYNATKTLIDNYALNIARLGNNDKEDENLNKARLNYFSLAPSAWGALGFIASAENYYYDGLSELEKYKENVKNGKATYNVKTDDLHTAFELAASDRLLGYALGLLESADETMFYELDNNIYEAQGIVLVVRDFIKALYELYPVDAKNNQENFDYALRYLDLVATFDPLWISTKPFNSGALVRSYLLNVKNRLEDIRDSIRM